MPPLRLTTLLQSAFPALSQSARAVVSTLACRNGKSLPAAEVAAWVGLRDRYRLRRALRRAGLPPLEALVGWTRIIYWLSEAETSGSSLLQIARREGVDPASAYRLVRRVTGRRWSQVRREGLAKVVAYLRAHCPPPRAGRGERVAISTSWPRVGGSLGAAPPAAPGRPACVLAERVSVPGAPFDVTITSAAVALTTRVHAAAVGVLALDPLRVIASLPTGAAPTRVVAERSGERAYVTAQFAEQVEVLNLRAGRLDAVIPVPGHPLGAVLAGDGRALFVTTNLDQLHLVRPAAKRIVASTSIPMGSPQIAMHPRGHRVYASGYRTGTIAEYDATTLRHCRTFELGGIVQDIVLSPDGATLYAANEAGWVDVLALRTGRSLTRIECAAAALGLALSPDGTLLLASLVFAGRIALIDPRRGSLRATLAPGGKPRLMAFTADGRMALIANEAGWVDVVR